MTRDELLALADAADNAAVEITRNTDASDAAFECAYALEALARHIRKISL
jgi:hypothetical protein